jgi:hypothetical protein
MQQRVEAHDSLDDFPTPPWATRALTGFLRGLGHNLGAMAAWEPCCNRGFMVKPLRESFASVRASDVLAYPDHVLGGDPELIDFATTGRSEPAVDFVIANPPFRLAEAFIETAIGVSRVGCAMLVRTSFVEGRDRYLGLFAPERTPPDFVLVFTQRVVMLKGRLIRDGAPDPFNLDDDGKPKKASTATSYVWLVWLAGGDRDTRVRWIPPCRAQLEREGDYPVYAMPGALAEAGGLFSPG